MDRIRFILITVAIGMMAFHLGSPSEFGSIQGEQETSFAAEAPHNKLVLASTQFQNKDPYQFSDINTDFILIDIHNDIADQGIQPLLVHDSNTNFRYTFERNKDFFLLLFSKLTFA